MTDLYLLFRRVWARMWVSASSSTTLCCWSSPNRTWCLTTQCETATCDLQIITTAQTSSNHSTANPVDVWVWYNLTTRTQNPYIFIDSGYIHCYFINCHWRVVALSFWKAAVFVKDCRSCFFVLFFICTNYRCFCRIRNKEAFFKKEIGCHWSGE